MNRVSEQDDINSIEGKKKAILVLVATLASINNEFERSEYVRKCAEKWGGEIREVNFNEGSGVRESGTFILAIIRK